MRELIHIKSVSQFHQLVGHPKPKHPLVSVERDVQYGDVSDLDGIRIVADFYIIVFKEDVCGKLTYGHNSYDFEEGTLLFFAPGQVLEYEKSPDMASAPREAWRLLFHPDLIRKSELASQIDAYNFFDYDLSEGLHLSEDEKYTVEEILEKIASKITGRNN